MPKLMRHEDGLLPNTLALAYTLGGYAGGVFLLTVGPWYWNALGVLLTAHALVLSAYLIHEFTHHTIFASQRLNAAVGRLLCWVNGACFAGFDDLAHKHIRHHADRLDVVTFDYRAILKRSPGWARKLVLALEWAYIPAVELLMKGLVVALPFFYEGRRAQRGQVLAMLALRVALFAALGYYAPKALLLYVLAYFLFLHAMRFLDCFQHTFDVFPVMEQAAAPKALRRDKQYEHENTYSNLISTRWPRLNLLVLNFPYHNAHHARPSVPWYKLPALHRELYGEHDPQVLPCRRLLASYHRNRVQRVLAEDYGEVNTAAGRTEGFIGAVGVNFLTAV